ncbi:TolC family protein, partial [Sandarakinorhabdus oryzae]|uniref:TolC family protein n=1 Tax=Sandarakinorhabdus oryzae TaxID=2675220 RepID=UPI0018CC46EB
MMRPVVLIALMPVLILAGCAVGPSYKGPPTVTASAAPAFDRAPLAQAAADAPLQAWWRQLGDAQLDALIGSALAHNRDLAAAEANLRAARALLSERTADFLPSSQVSASYQRQGFSSQGQAFGSGFALPERDFYSIGIDSSWEIDLFGRLTRRRQEALAQAGSAQAVRNDLKVSIVAETVSTYLALRGAQQRLDVAEQSAANQASSADLSEKLLRAGRGTGLDVARANALLATTRASMAPLAAEVDVAIHRLGVLTGASPSALRGQLDALKPLPALPATLSVGDPASLLR